jgi:YbbR domain-containing protein
MKMKFWLKVLSVLMAIALWMFVISRGQSEVAMEVPISYANVPKGLEVVKGESAGATSVGIRGHERFLKNLRTGDVRVVLDLSHVKKGRHLFGIKRKDVVLPAPLRLISISPSTVLVTVEEVVTKEVPVRASIIGLPPAGYSLRAVQVTPEEVTVSGVRSEVRKVKALETEPIDISAARETLVMKVSIDAGGLDVRPSASSVTVRIIIAEERR